MTFFRTLAYVFIGVGFASIAWGEWAGFYLGVCGGVLWVLHRKEPA